MTTPDLETLIVTVTDLRLAGHCPSGIRRWFNSKPDLSFNHFMKHGYPAQTLLDTGDALAIQTVEAKLARESSDG